MINPVLLWYATIGLVIGLIFHYVNNEFMNEEDRLDGKDYVVLVMFWPIIVLMFIAALVRNN